MFLSSQRVIQLTALEDWSVSEKQQWDSAVKFMESTLQDELDKGIQQTEIRASFLSDFLTVPTVLCYWFKKHRATYNQSQQTFSFRSGTNQGQNVSYDFPRLVLVA